MSRYTEWWSKNKDLVNAWKRRKYRNDIAYREWDKARHQKRGKYDFNANMERDRFGRFTGKKKEKSDNVA